jgi:hypothetical protein
MPSRLPRSKIQIDFFPKVRRPRKTNSYSSLQKDSLARTYKRTIVVPPHKEEPTHGFEYFPLWLDIKALWFGINWCFSQAFAGFEAVAGWGRNKYGN